MVNLFSLIILVQLWVNCIIQFHNKNYTKTETKFYLLVIRYLHIKMEPIVYKKIK